MHDYDALVVTRSHNFELLEAVKLARYAGGPSKKDIDVSGGTGESGTRGMSHIEAVVQRSRIAKVGAGGLT